MKKTKGKLWPPVFVTNFLHTPVLKQRKIVLFFVVPLCLFYPCNSAIFLSLLASNALYCYRTSKTRTWACKTAHRRENNEHRVCRNSWEWQAPASGLYHWKWQEVDCSYQQASPFCWCLHYKTKNGKPSGGGVEEEERGRREGEREGIEEEWRRGREAEFEIRRGGGVLTLMGTN